MRERRGAVQKPLEEAPLIAAGRGGPVAVGLGAGVVAAYLPLRLALDPEPDFAFFEASPPGSTALKKALSFDLVPVHSARLVFVLTI